MFVFFVKRTLHKNMSYTHYTVHQKVCENQFSCSVCKKVFASNISLSLHKNISSHFSGISEKGISVNNIFIRHNTVHSSESDTTTQSPQEYKHDNLARDMTAWSSQYRNDNLALDTTTWSSQEDKNDNPSRDTTTSPLQEDKNDNPSQDTTTWSSQEDKNDNSSRDTTTSSLQGDKNDNPSRNKTPSMVLSQMDKGKNETLKMCENLEGENQSVRTVYYDGSVYTVCNDSSAAELTDPLKIKKPILQLKRNKTYTYFRCTICKRAFCSKRNVAKHVMLKHKEMLPYTSTIYEKIDYVMKDDRDVDHRNLKRPPPTPFYTCKVCNQDFPVEFELRNHMRIHETASCRVGDKACLTNAVTRYPHLRNALSSSVCGKDRGEIYSCTVCQKAFSSRIHLRHHMSSHRSGHKVEEACSCSIGGNVSAPNMGMEDDSEKHKTDTSASCCVSKDGFPVNTNIIRQPDGTNEISFLSDQLKTDNSVLCSLLSRRRENTDTCQSSCDWETVNAKVVNVKPAKDVAVRQWYICNDCKIGYAHAWELKLHMKTHRRIFGKAVMMTKNVIGKTRMCESLKVGRICSLCGSDSSQYWCVEESEDQVMLCDQCLDVWIQCSICNKMMKFLNLKCHIWDHLGS